MKYWLKNDWLFFLKHAVNNFFKSEIYFHEQLVFYMDTAIIS